MMFALAKWPGRHVAGSKSVSPSGATGRPASDASGVAWLAGIGATGTARQVPVLQPTTTEDANGSGQCWDDQWGSAPVL